MTTRLIDAFLFVCAPDLVPCMAYNRKQTKHSPIIFLCDKHKITLNDVCRLLDISNLTLRNGIINPFKLTLGQITALSGLLGLNVLELVYLLTRNQQSMAKKKKTGLADKWYLEDLKAKVDGLPNQLEQLKGTDQ
jgi:hypothetical protein